MDPDSPEALATAQRNAFYGSLAPEAKARFLQALEASQARGLDETAAWREAVVAAETAYPPEPIDENL